MSTYASFQGRVFLGKRDIDGLPIEVRSPGNVAELKLSLKTDVLEHYESQTGQRSLDHRMVKQKSAAVNLTIEEFTKENLALALYGNHITGTTGSVTAETIGGATPVVGDRYFFAHPKVSAVVVTDSAGTPATLVAGTHYTVDTDFGALQFLDTTGLPHRSRRPTATASPPRRRYALSFSASSSNRFPSLSFGIRIKLAITAAFNFSNSRTMSFTSSQ